VVLRDQAILLPASIALRSVIDPKAGLVLADSTQIHQVLLSMTRKFWYFWANPRSKRLATLSPEARGFGSLGPHI
jgi:hypothetical protein